MEQPGSLEFPYGVLLFPPVLFCPWSSEGTECTGSLLNRGDSRGHYGFQKGSSTHDIIDDRIPDCNISSLIIPRSVCIHTLIGRMTGRCLYSLVDTYKILCTILASSLSSWDDLRDVNPWPLAASAYTYWSSIVLGPRPVDKFSENIISDKFWSDMFQFWNDIHDYCSDK